MVRLIACLLCWFPNWDEKLDNFPQRPISPDKDLGFPGRYKLTNADYPIDYEVFPIYLSKL